MSARDTALSLPSLGAADTGHPHKWLVLVAVSTGLILGILDASVVNIAIPTLMSGLSASVSEISWVLNAYNVAQAVLFLTFGRLAERFGQRVVFIGSLVVFTVFSLACGLSPNVEWLIVFRIGQAVGAAGIVPVSLIILLSAFPQREHGLATGLWGSLGTVAAIIGPPIGGVLIQYATWNWIFFMNVPIGIVAIAISLLVVPELRRDEDGAGIDLPGILLVGSGHRLSDPGDHRGRRLGLGIGARDRPACWPPSCSPLVSSFGRNGPRGPCSTSPSSGSRRSPRRRS